MKKPKWLCSNLVHTNFSLSCFDALVLFRPRVILFSRRSPDYAHRHLNGRILSQTSLLCLLVSVASYSCLYPPQTAAGSGTSFDLAGTKNTFVHLCINSFK